MNLGKWFAGQFEIARTAGSKPMEGLRGLAVALVFLVHYVTLSEPWTREWLAPLTNSLHSIGSFGVDIFFLLSGYLIYGSLIARAQPFGQYLNRRVQRIYPAFLAVLTLYLAISYAVPSMSKIPDERAVEYIAANVLLLPGIFEVTPIITVAWSLSFEMFFYLSVPLLIGALFLRAWPAYARIVLFVALALTCATFTSGDHVRIVMFIAGMLVCEAKKLWRAPPAVIAGAALVTALLTPILPAHGSLRLAVLFVSCAVICWHCIAARSWLSRAFEWTPLRWLGNMSYSYYLIHGLALKMAFAALAEVIGPGQDLFVWLIVPMFALTLIPSAVLYILIERPLSIGVTSPLVSTRLGAPASVRTP